MGSRNFEVNWGSQACLQLKCLPYAKHVYVCSASGFPKDHGYAKSGPINLMAFSQDFCQSPLRQDDDYIRKFSLSSPDPFNLERGAHLGVGILAQNALPPQSGAKKRPKMTSDHRIFFFQVFFQRLQSRGGKGFSAKRGFSNFGFGEASLQHRKRKSHSRWETEPSMAANPNKRSVFLGFFFFFFRGSPNRAKKRYWISYVHNFTYFSYRHTPTCGNDVLSYLLTH